MRGSKSDEGREGATLARTRGERIVNLMLKVVVRHEGKWLREKYPLMTYGREESVEYGEGNGRRKD